MVFVIDYTKIKDYYDNKRWNKGMVWDAVSKGKITQDEYTQITGDVFPTERPAD